MIVKGVVRNMSWSEKYQLLATGTYGGLLMVVNFK